MEDESEKLFRNLLPKEWVVRKYKPDYGIDLAIEVFKYLDPEESIADTLGEHFLVQLKSMAVTNISTLRVYSHNNVAKSPLKHNKDDFLDIEVIKCEIDTTELFTIETMGNGTPVILIMATLDTRRVFFVCLNDLIDKVIVPENPDYAEQAQKTIYIPVLNEITSDPATFVPLRFYAKRAKFYSSFVLFEYQRNELVYADSNQIAGERMIHFLRILDRLDIWDDCSMWKIVSDYRDQLSAWRKAYAKNGITNGLLTDAERIWTGLVSLAHNYEEVCREWFLPTHFSQFLSYPPHSNRSSRSNILIG